MTIEVLAHPKSKQKKLVIKENIFHAYIHSPPEKGKANSEVQILLADYFNLPKSSICLIKGEKFKHKIFQIIKQ
ncbi:MAG: DUF167 domain-containing protein [Spirochaetia bacterium]|nr:DUF167 domain-containing protein [Spirochaetia bacterium]